MLNKVTFQGRMVADPELKTTASGIDYLNFKVAWSEKYKEVETKCFLPCKAWRQTAKFISQYFRKGQQIVIEGRLETETWTTDDGQNRSAIVCVLDKAHFCGDKKTAEKSYETVTDFVNSDDFVAIPDGVDDSGLPFN